jgi:SPP1 family predicted phage head-tail adaptor
MLRGGGYGKTVVAREMFRSVLTLQKNTPTQDDNGQPVESWADERNIRAQVIPKSSREFIRNGNVDDDVTALIKTRYASDITPLYRLKASDGTIYNIKSAVDPDSMGRLLMIEAVREAV